MNEVLKKELFRKRPWFPLVLVLLALAVVTVVIWFVFTDGGNVTVKRLSVAGDDGATYSCIAFIPKTATNEKPAPAVINNHGNTSTAISILAYGIEQSRRGYVALMVDMAGRGGSEFPADGDVGKSISTWVRYCLDAPYVDSEHLNMVGFSMSGALAPVAAVPYIEHFDSVIAFSSGGGNVITSEIPVNFLVIRGGDDDLIQFDETGNRKEVITFADNQQIDDFQMNMLYGSFADKTARMYRNIDGMIHIGASFDGRSISSMLDFLQNAAPAPKPLDAGNMVYLWKDWFGLMAMCLLVALILALVNFLSQVNLFAPIIQKMPPNIGLRGKGWWISAILSLAVPLLIFSKATNKQPDWFPIGQTFFKFALPNGIMIFLMCLVLISLVMGCLFHFNDGKKNGASLCTYGLTGEGDDVLNWAIIGRSFGMAVLIVALIVTIINGVNLFLGTEYSFWVLDFSSFSAQRIMDSIPYMLPYLVAFITSSFGMNIERRLEEGSNQRLNRIKTYAANIGFNAGGILLIVIINLLSAAQSPLNKQAVGGGLYSLFAWGMVFAMSYIAIINTYCFRKTGTIWLGAFINALLVPLMLCNGVPYGAATTVQGEQANAAFGFAPVAGAVIVLVYLAALVYFSRPHKVQEL